jgi:hypothetical protein
VFLHEKDWEISCSTDEFLLSHHKGVSLDFLRQPGVIMGDGITLDP